VFGDIASNPKTMERSESVEFFDSETLFADERGISVCGDIILGSHVFHAELSNGFIRKNHPMLYESVLQLDPKF
jgi:hypothetical protein